MAMLTMKQVAERLGYENPTAAYHLIHRKRDPLPAVRLGMRGGYRVEPDALAAWIKRQAVAA